MAGFRSVLVPCGFVHSGGVMMLSASPFVSAALPAHVASWAGELPMMDPDEVGAANLPPVGKYDQLLPTSTISLRGQATVFI